MQHYILCVYGAHPGIGSEQGHLGAGMSSATLLSWDSFK